MSPQTEEQKEEKVYLSEQFANQGLTTPMGKPQVYSAKTDRGGAPFIKPPPWFPDWSISK